MMCHDGAAGSDNTEGRGIRSATQSRGVAFRPEAGDAVVLLAVLQILCRYAAHQWIG